MSKWSKAKEHLESIMPKWVHEAELYGASYCHGMGELVCTEPEGYAYKIAIEALEIAERLGGAEPKDIDICEECELDFVKDCSEWCYPARRYRDGYQQAIEDVRGKNNG